MKKRLVLFVVLVLLVSLVSIPAQADNKSRGETVTFNLTLSGSYSGVTSMGVKFNYDTSVLTLQSGSWGLEGALKSIDVAKNTGVIAFPGGTSVSGTILSVTFTVNSGASIGATGSVGATVTIRPSEQTENVNIGSVTVICSHSFGAYTKVSDTEHSHTCSSCGDTEKSAHNWNGGNVIKAATCKETGTIEHTCTDCGAKKTDTIPTSDGHQYGTATKVNDSEHTHTCSICGKTEQASHNWTVQTVTKEETCKETGMQTLVCKDCGATKEESIPTSGEHQYGAYSDCGDGKHQRTCSVCGNVEKENHIVGSDYHSNSTGHWRECEKCSAEEKEEHTFIDGKCTVCGYEEVVEEVEEPKPENKGTASRWWLWIFIGIVVGAGGGIAAVYFLIMKKKK